MSKLAPHKLRGEVAHRKWKKEGIHRQATSEPLNNREKEISGFDGRLFEFDGSNINVYGVDVHCVHLKYTFYSSQPPRCACFHLNSES